MVEKRPDTFSSAIRKKTREAMRVQARVEGF